MLAQRKRPKEATKATKAKKPPKPSKNSKNVPTKKDAGKKGGQADVLSLQPEINKQPATGDQHLHNDISISDIETPRSTNEDSSEVGAPPEVNIEKLDSTPDNTHETDEGMQDDEETCRTPEDDDTIKSLIMERQNTKQLRFADEKPKTDDKLLRRERTTLERQKTVYPQFERSKTLAYFERSKTDTDLALKARPGTSLDGHNVEWVDCTDDGVGDNDYVAPPFSANAVLKGDDQNNIQLDPNVVPLFNQERDNIVVWPFGDGTIRLPKPPPRQLNPPAPPELTGINQPDKWVRINIGGTLFYTRVSTLSRCPGSRLTDLVCNDSIPVDIEREYRFDRSPVMFAHILDYYRYGILHVPQGVCISALRYELEFWRLPESIIAHCCWETYAQPDDDAEVVKKLDGYDIPHNTDTSCCPIRDCRYKLQLMLRFPGSSWYAKLWAVCYVLLVIASTLSLILDTVRSCRVTATRSGRLDPNETNPKQIMLDTTDSHPAIIIIEIVTSLVFSVDLVLRFYSCVSYCDYALDLLNWADIASVMAEWILLLLITSTEYWNNHHLLELYKVCSFIRVLRVLRLFRLARTYKGLRLFLLAMTQSMKELLLLMVLMLLGVIIFATMIYYAEFSDLQNNFPDIPFSFWWAIVTMTTVGYGDFVPTTSAGYIVGALCAVTGMLFTSLPLPIIATNFQMYYHYSQIKERMRRRKRNEDGSKPAPSDGPVRLPTMKTWDTFQSTFFDDTTRPSSKTTFNNRAFSPSDSGVFDEQNDEKVDNSNRPRAALLRNNNKYSMLRNDSNASDISQAGASGANYNRETTLSTVTHRDATTLSITTADLAFSRYNTNADMGISRQNTTAHQGISRHNTTAHQGIFRHNTTAHQGISRQNTSTDTGISRHNTKAELGVSSHNSALPDIGSSSPRISSGSEKNSSLNRQLSQHESNA